MECENVLHCGDDEHEGEVDAGGHLEVREEVEVSKVAHNVGDEGGQAARQQKSVHVTTKDDLGHHVVRACTVSMDNKDVLW